MLMIKNRKSSLAALAAIGASLLLAGCQTPSDVAEADAKPDPRQGAEVRNICFQSQIRGWRELDNKSVIVEVGVRDEYKLELIGACRPEDAFTEIGLVSRGGGSCLSTGDRLVTDERFGDGSCSIRRIYEWHKDGKPAEGSEATAG
jgi:hypothetical protein